MVVKRFRANASDAGVRADVFVASKYPHYARSALAKLFKADSILIGNQALKPGYKIRLGDILKIDDSLLNLDVPDIKMEVLYEDDDVLVVNKSSGVLSHSNGGLSNEASVASFIRYKVASEITKNNHRAGIVHRLDRATSGVMICAKTPPALSFLQKQFQTRKTKKVYLAICSGKLKENEAVIEAPIKRQQDRKKRPFWVQNGGKPSLTEYKVIKRKQEYCWVELMPRTGRTHQIRVHMAFAGAPVIGDYLYGGIRSDRLMLHASELEITLPNNERKKFCAPTPPEFAKFWRSLK